MTDDLPLWERRYRAPEVTFPAWARHAPHRLVFAANESGSWQVYAADLRDGLRRRVTELPVGTQRGTVTPDGAAVVWFDDRTGDEVGRWLREPFAGGSRPEPLVDGVPVGWSAGLGLGDAVTVVGVADDDGYAVYRSVDGGPAETLHRHPEWLDVGPLDRAEQAVVLSHAERGDLIHPALRVLDVRTGATLGELDDGPGHGIAPAAWAPVAGDLRLAFTSDRSGRERPGIWDVGTDERTDLALEQLPGDVTAVDWWPDASALLLRHDHDGRSQLWRLDLDATELTAVPVDAGTVHDAAVRPDGAVWLRASSGAHAPRVRAAGSDADVTDADVADADVTDADVVAAEGPPAPDGYPYRSWEFRNPHGQRVHGFVAVPPGEGSPYPLVMLIHGGPAAYWADAWRAEVSAWVDHGFAVAMVNYRGSTGYGPAWRDAIIGAPGLTELEDVIAGLDDLVASGLADRDRLVVAGGSWGGYLSLLALGQHPDRWAAGIAIVPVADYVAAYEDEAPALQALDRVLFGGGAAELPDRYAERSPITYVDAVRAPLLVITGANDTRCPIRQVRNYVERLTAAGRDVELDVFDAGHGSLVVEERIRHVRLQMDFLARQGLLAR